MKKADYRTRLIQFLMVMSCLTVLMVSSQSTLAKRFSSQSLKQAIIQGNDKALSNDVNSNSSVDADATQDKPKLLLNNNEDRNLAYTSYYNSYYGVAYYSYYSYNYYYGYTYSYFGSSYKGTYYYYSYYSYSTYSYYSYLSYSSYLYSSYLYSSYKYYSSLSNYYSYLSYLSYSSYYYSSIYSYYSYYYSYSSYIYYSYKSYLSYYSYSYYSYYSYLSRYYYNLYRYYDDWERSTYASAVTIPAVIIPTVLTFMISLIIALCSLPLCLKTRFRRGVMQSCICRKATKKGKCCKRKKPLYKRSGSEYQKAVQRGLVTGSASHVSVVPSSMPVYANSTMPMIQPMQYPNQAPTVMYGQSAYGVQPPLPQAQYQVQPQAYPQQYPPQPQGYPQPVNYQPNQVSYDQGQPQTVIQVQINPGQPGQPAGQLNVAPSGFDSSYNQQDTSALKLL